MISQARLMASFVSRTASPSMTAMVRARANASASRRSRGTTRFTSPISFASAAPTRSFPVRGSGLLRPHHPGQEERDDPAAKPELRLAEQRVLRGHRDVARQRQLAGAGEAEAVDGRGVDTEYSPMHPSGPWR